MPNTNAIGRLARSLLRLSRNLLAALGALFAAVLFTPLVPWAALLLPATWTDANHGVLIILSGTSTRYSGSPPASLIGSNSYWRAIHAIHVWRKGHFDNVLLSGSDAAETIKPLLIAWGIPEKDILVENQSQNTHENATLSKPILVGLPGPYVLLTSDYHVYRASRCFAHEGISVQTVPAPDLSKRCTSHLQRWDAFCDLLREFAAVAYYRYRGWI